MYRRKRNILQNHPIQDNLEDNMLRLKPKMDLLDQLSKLHESTGDKNLGMQVDKQRKELNDQINEISKKTGISFVDAYSKLQGEKIKNEVLEGREKAEQRLKDGKGDDDTVDLLDENGVLITRIKNMEQLKNKKDPSNILETGHKNWQRHLDGHHIDDLDTEADFEQHQRTKYAQLLGIEKYEQAPQEVEENDEEEGFQYKEKHRTRLSKRGKKVDERYYKKYKLNPDYESLKPPRFVIPRATKLSAGMLPHKEKLFHQKHINQQNEEAKRHQDERENIHRELERKIFGRKRIQKLIRDRQQIKEAKQQVQSLREHKQKEEEEKQDKIKKFKEEEQKAYHIQGKKDEGQLEHLRRQLKPDFEPKYDIKGFDIPTEKEQIYKQLQKVKTAKNLLKAGKFRNEHLKEQKQQIFETIKNIPQTKQAKFEKKFGKYMETHGKEGIKHLIRQFQDEQKEEAKQRGKELGILSDPKVKEEEEEEKDVPIGQIVKGTKRDLLQQVYKNSGSKQSYETWYKEQGPFYNKDLSKKPQSEIDIIIKNRDEKKQQKKQQKK